MMRTIPILLAVVVSVASASIPSSGLDTAAGIRGALPDSAFRINPAKGIVNTQPDFTTQNANLANFPALAGADVQTQIVRVFIRAGQSFLTHSHPRSSEALNLIRGVLDVSFTFEGSSNPRVVRNRLRAGESTVFPQGLVHSVRCVSKRNCMYVATFNSADPGFVLAQ